MGSQHLRIHHSQHPEERDQDRKLKGHAEQDEKLQAGRVVGIDGQKRHVRRRAVGHEELEGGWKENEVREPGSAQEEERRRRDEWNDELALSWVKARRD